MKVLCECRRPPQYALFYLSKPTISLGLVHRRCVSGRAWLYGATMAQMLGWTATFLFTVCYIPQIVKSIRTGKVDGVSLTLFVIQFVANIVALVYAIMIGQNPLIIKYSLAIVLVGLVIIVYLRIALKGDNRLSREELL